MMVSVRSTEVTPDDGAGGGDWPGPVNFAAAVLPPDLAGAGAAAVAAFADCGLAALLEMTNLRRIGAGFTLGAFRVWARLLCGADLGTVTLRFDIKIQTKKSRAGSEIMTVDRKNTASDETPAFVAVKLNCEHQKTDARQY